MEQEHILNTHIDTLAKWWENAEKGAPNKGDAIIRRTERILSNGYAYEVGTEDYTDAKHLYNVRILARAPKPKPAWHDAVAVIASHDLDRHETITGVWTPDGTPDAWESQEGIIVSPESLYNVTPLIEAKVTDEMAKRLENHFLDSANMALPTGLARTMLTAALGLDPA